MLLLFMSPISKLEDNFSRFSFEKLKSEWTRVDILICQTFHSQPGCQNTKDVSENCLNEKPQSFNPLNVPTFISWLICNCWTTFKIWIWLVGNSRHIYEDDRDSFVMLKLEHTIYWNVSVKPKCLSKKESLLCYIILH